jgi:ATP-dependent Clp protease protease subunit
LDADNPTEPSGGATGQASDIAIHAKEILRVRQVLTSIYQRHCGQEGESQAEGIARFGTWALSVLRESLYLNVTAERALERDYYMTGSSTLNSSVNCCLNKTISTRSCEFRHCRRHT